VHFSRLQVTGFKSFVDTTELYIEPGMTGVIGPNGCGKSNVVEALRWVMGETSPKSMRGGEMEDVIFGGTASRPSRNIAEVTLKLDNSDRTAPASFNDSEEIEVSRRIERGAGSAYRINGKDVRARDVQLLFADLASGAHSTAMVSQGRIGALIGAKPTERRVLLEEAAGIRGLHSRRHEAELRLRAAETNLSRLDDVIEALEGQHQGLQRQARQAVRYRRLSENIRKHEAVLLHLRWRDSAAALETARIRFREAEATVVQRTETAGIAAARQAEIAAALPELREKEAEAAAELQRLIMARNELEREEARIAEAQSEAERRLQQISGDIEREASLAAEAKRATERFETEVQTIDAALANEADTAELARAALESITAQVDAKDTERNELLATVAETEANRATLERQQSQLSEQIEKLKRRASEMEEERLRLAVEVADNSALETIRQSIGEAERRVTAAQDAASGAEETLKTAQSEEARAREQAREMEAERDRLSAEIRALAELVEPSEGDFFAPLIESISVEPGYEAALGVALGEDIDAPVDTAAPVYWAILPSLSVLQQLPDRVKPLVQFVKAPPALHRRLSQIGIVEDDATGDLLHPTLKPGQRIVSKQGGLWRWDGYRISAGAPTPAAARLGQRNRLDALREKQNAIDPDFKAGQAVFEAAKSKREDAETAERSARQALNEAFSALNEARQAYGDVSGDAAAAKSRLTALADAANQAALDLEEADSQWNSTRRALEELEDPGAKRAMIDGMRATLGELRADQSEKRSAYDRLKRESEERAARRRNVVDELATWRNRSQGAAARLGDLEERRNAAEVSRNSLAARPAEITAQRNTLLGKISESEERRGGAADNLAQGETAQNEADKSLRAAEAQLAESREQRVRCESQVEQAMSDNAAIKERIAERLECSPEAVLKEAGVPEDETLPDPETVETKMGRQVRERDNMGPVNLRAEIEAQELETQIQSMQTEREDLVAAIARLRQGIGQLNREGRERLLAAFETVNTHFQELFVKLFGGGRAYLTLTEAEDPLEAGLEIMASPPGKKLQVMSLLSGGEQALTAISLLFGVFLTNPAPICVLDEVDAPLDDANVERFCNLLGEISGAGDTRFLIITHHRITMARMDRLFGVTMGERGVSQLVSVDLQRAQELRATA
jgi:chromosome segregation protein